VKRDHLIRALLQCTVIEQSLTILLEYFEHRDSLNTVSYHDTYLQYQYCGIDMYRKSPKGTQVYDAGNVVTMAGKYVKVPFWLF